MTLRFPYVTLKRRTQIRAMREEIDAASQAARTLEILKAVPPKTWPQIIAHHSKSKSQVQQDLFALALNDVRHGGYFVEFGATDGVDISNTWLLETHFGWKGILAEPARIRHADLRRNRRCHIDTRCVWSGETTAATGGRIEFTEHIHPDLSGVSALLPRRRWCSTKSTAYEVETITLNDLLSEYSAPAHIDYLSVDTEGSELAILSACDFDRWSFGALTVEHNFLPQREAIHALLASHGYKRILTHISEQDDWYVPV